jgi:hypothetical protein
MGWREGYGIGPRKKRGLQSLLTSKIASLRNLVKKSKSKPQVFGVAGVTRPDDGDDEDDEDDPHALGLLFAPKNTQIHTFHQKDNLWGIGFDPHTGAAEFKVARRGGNDDKKQRVHMTSIFGEGWWFQCYTRCRIFQTKFLGRKMSSRFGLGALEEDEEHDPYESVDMSKYDRVIGGSARASNKVTVSTEVAR